MKMLILFMVVMLFCGNQSFAGNIDVGAAASLKETYPNYMFDKVESTEVPGLFLVYGKKNIIYYMPKSGHLFFGDVWNSEGKNISEAPRKEVLNAIAANQAKQMKDVVDQIPLELAIKIGDGPKKVIEVTDPDCPFCRKGSEFFKKRDDVTRYVFFMPIPQLHPQAKAKASYVLSSEDPAVAYEEVMAGEYDTKALPAFIDNGIIEKHLQVAQQLGVKGTPNYWVIDAGEAVSGADFAKLNQLLQ